MTKIIYAFCYCSWRIRMISPLQILYIMPRNTKGEPTWFVTIMSTRGIHLAQSLGLCGHIVFNIYILLHLYLKCSYKSQIILQSNKICQQQHQWDCQNLLLKSYGYFQLHLLFEQKPQQVWVWLIKCRL